MRSNSILTTMGCAIVLVHVGCITPWSPPPSSNDVSRSASTRSATPNTQVPATPELRLAASQPDMASVLDKIQQVRALDPAAEPKLLEELRNVPAESWPLVAEQFRASLAYRQQLAQKEKANSRESQPVVDLRRAPPIDGLPGRQAKQIAAADLAYERGVLSNDDRPSAPIGSLVDPHLAAVASEPVIARAASHALPSAVAEVTVAQVEPTAPAQFSADGPAYPIASTNRDSSEVQSYDAKQAIAHAASPSFNKQAGAEEIGAKAIRLPDTSAPATNETWQQLVRKAIADLDKRVSRSPTTTAEVHQHVSLRVLQLLAGDTENALEPIPHISPTEQDYWSRQLFALATYLDHHSQPDDKRRASTSVSHLEEAVSNLRELGSLSLRNLSFCKNVYGYGAFDTYDTDVFTPGQQVSLYVEVENYHSTASDKGFTTLLGTTYEVLDDRGKRVASGDFPDVNDCCRSRRRDFHIQLGLALPQNITPGRYQLQLVVKDRQSDKIGNAKAAFEVRGGKK